MGQEVYNVLVLELNDLFMINTFFSMYMRCPIPLSASL